MQQFPKIGKTDSKTEVSCWNWTIYDDRRKICVTFKSDTEKLDIVMNRYQNSFYLEGNKNDLNTTEYEKDLANQVYLLSNTNTFYRLFVVLENNCS